MLLRVVNLNQIRGVPPLQLAVFLENLPLTKQSAVLSEKLGDLNAASGKPASTLRNYERALELDPSPQQSIRLRLKLGDTLMAQKKYPEAANHWLAMYRAFPDYPGKQDIAVKLSLAESEAKKAVATNSPPTATSNSPAVSHSSQ
jgi:tetratricopeptide (TPR) repeat protein